MSTQTNKQLFGMIYVIDYFDHDTQLPNGVKVAVSDQSQNCQKLTKVDLTCSLHLY